MLYRLRGFTGGRGEACLAGIAVYPVRSTHGTRTQAHACWTVCLALNDLPIPGPLAAPADGKSAIASIAVPIARRPACTATGGSCLSVSPTSGPLDTTSFTLTASGFVADGALTYDFGVQDASSGRRNHHMRGAAERAFTFAAHVLPVGENMLFVCAKGKGVS